MIFCRALRKKPPTTSGVQMLAYAAIACPSGARSLADVATKAEHRAGSHDMDSWRRAAMFLHNQRPAGESGYRAQRLKEALGV